MGKPLIWQKNRGVLEAGCDEAGRGCLAGPVFAAAVILPKTRIIKGLNDSKKLSEKKRDLLAEEIIKKALSWAVVKVSHKQIDKINILNASILAMQKAVLKLDVKPQILLIDGNRFKPFKKFEYSTEIKGDGKFASIAAASILAKTFRDKYMLKLHKRFPEYDWQKNKGYPTKHHRETIKKIGATSYHRQSFTWYTGHVKQSSKT